MHRTITLTTLIMLSAAVAEARPARINQIPNAPQGCATCHVNGNGGPRNLFGQDVESTLIGAGAAGVVNWPAVANLDSDNDSFSNGLELGDPDGNWSQGDAAPGGTITNPADAQSAPGGAADNTGDETADDTAGGCRTADGTQAITWPLLAVGGVWLLRRRRGLLDV